MFENAQRKTEIKNWIRSQESPPSRKSLKEAFPGVPLRDLKAALQSAKSEQRS